MAVALLSMIASWIAILILRLWNLWADEQFLAAVDWLAQRHFSRWLGVALQWSSENPGSAAVVATCILILVLLVTTFAHERVLAARRESPAATAVVKVPDVIVLYDWTKDWTRDERGGLIEVPPPPFEVRNYGAPAVEVRIENIVGSIYAARFPVIPDLFEGASKLVTPAVDRVNEVVAGIARELSNLSIEELLESAYRKRQREYMNAFKAPMSDKQLAAAEKVLDKKLSISFRVTYWDRSHTRQWARTEHLSYEPDGNHAYVEHGAVVEITNG